MERDVIFHGEAQDGVFIVESHLPGGTSVGQHAHTSSHLSYLASGVAFVSVDGVQKMYTAPRMLTIEANKEHNVHAVTDVVWLCIWPHGEDIQIEAKASLAELEA